MAIKSSLHFIAIIIKSDVILREYLSIQIVVSAPFIKVTIKANIKNSIACIFLGHISAGGSDGVIFIWNVSGVLVTTLKEHKLVDYLMLVFA